jgi:ubiquinone biosynthesis protein UbiJ
MFKPLVARFLQHITQQNNWSRQHLMPFASKVVQFEVAFIKTNLLILEDGSLGISPTNTPPDAIIYASPSLLVRILSGDENAKRQIKIDGDIHLATELGKILQLMRWDIEEDLSQIIGDIAANKTVAASKKAFGVAKDQSINLAEMLTEYWQEENPILAKKRHITQFNAEVDNLRNDVARFEKRLEILSKKLAEGSIH